MPRSAALGGVAVQVPHRFRGHTGERMQSWVGDRPQLLLTSSCSRLSAGLGSGLVVFQILKSTVYNSHPPHHSSASFPFIPAYFIHRKLNWKHLFILTHRGRQKKEWKLSFRCVGKLSPRKVWCPVQGSSWGTGAGAVCSLRRLLKAAAAVAVGVHSEPREWPRGLDHRRYTYTTPQGRVQSPRDRKRM